MVVGIWCVALVWVGLLVVLLTVYFYFWGLLYLCCLRVFLLSNVIWFTVGLRVWKGLLCVCLLVVVVVLLLCEVLFAGVYFCCAFRVFGFCGFCFAVLVKVGFNFGWMHVRALCCLWYLVFAFTL